MRAAAAADALRQPAVGIARGIELRLRMRKPELVEQGKERGRVLGARNRLAAVADQRVVACERGHELGRVLETGAQYEPDRRARCLLRYGRECSKQRPRPKAHPRHLSELREGGGTRARILIAERIDHQRGKARAPCALGERAAGQSGDEDAAPRQVVKVRASWKASRKS